MGQLERHETFEVPGAQDLWEIFALLDSLVAENAATWGNSAAREISMDTAKGSVSRPTLDELREVARLLGGSVDSLRRTYAGAESSPDGYRLSLSIHTGWSADRSIAGSITVTGPDDRLTNGFSIGLLQQIERCARARNRNHDSQVPSVSGRTICEPALAPDGSMSSMDTRIEAPSSDADPDGSLRPALPARPVARRRVKIPDSSSVDYAHLPDWALLQIQDELRTLGESTVRSDAFLSTTSVEDLADVSLEKNSEFQMEAPDRGWTGVRVTFGRYDATVLCIGSSAEARAVYSRVVAIIDACRNVRLIAARRFALIAFFISLGVYVGIVVRGLGIKSHDAPVAVAVFLLIDVVVLLASIVTSTILSTFTGPRVDVGASSPSWWSTNRNALLMVVVGAIAGGLFLVLIAYLGLKH